MNSSSTVEDYKVSKVVTKRPVLKDGTLQIHQETIEYTADDQQEAKAQ